MSIETAARTAPDPRVRRLLGTLYGYRFLGDLVPFYPVYALLFADTGLSVAQISSLFVVWSVTGLILEVPSGIWADMVSRRRLLAAAPVLSAAGYALWAGAPSYWAFGVGFVLWGACGCLQSGALEALVYEELDSLGAATRYPQVMGRAQAAGVAAAMLATAAASPVLLVGGYPVVGVASVATCLACGAVALRLPGGPRRVRGGGGPGGAGAVPGGAGAASAIREYVGILRSGLRLVAADRPVRRSVLLVPAVAAVWGALEEYVPLLSGETGVSEGVVPLLVVLVSGGATVGGLLAGAGQRLGSRGFAAVLGSAAVVLASGSLTGRPAGIAAVAVACAGFQMAHVVADARLQASITGPARATVTSVAALATEVAALGAYGFYATASTLVGHGVTFALLAVPYLVVAGVVLRWPGRIVPMGGDGGAGPGFEA